MHTIFKLGGKLHVFVLLAILVVLVTACASEAAATPTSAPTSTPVTTPTPNPESLIKQRVGVRFKTQVEAIQRGDWAAVYEVCSPEFRSARSLDRFIRDATAQFKLDGYAVPGFDARNVKVFVRAADRVRVRWDAYQDGRFIRTKEVGQTYILTQGDWFDEGAWCR
ncbi:MAG: hypothetical protein O2788_01075 [Chloroflexi bacterium]|nr:hypothetical protein [Chloroflexota bacterium]